MLGAVSAEPPDALRFAGRCLRIGTQCAGMAELTPIIVALLRQRFPGLEVELRPLEFAELFLACDRHDLDAVFGLAGLYGDRDDCTFDPVFADPVVALVGEGHAAAAAAWLDVADILAEPGIPLVGAPPAWAAPLMLADARNGYLPDAPTHMPSVVSFAEAVDAVGRWGLIAPSAASDRLMPVARSVPRVPVRDAAPLIFGVYTLHAARSGDRPDPLRYAARNAALDVAAAFMELLPGARDARAPELRATPNASPPNSAA